MHPLGPRLALFAALLIVAGCGGRGGGNGLSAEAARFDTRIAASGATLRATGLSCSGLYGTWNVELQVSGVAGGSGRTAFTLERGHEAQAPVSFAIHAGPLPGKATGLLHIRGRGTALAVTGRVKVSVPFKSVTREIAETIPVELGPAPGCGLGG